MLKSEISSNVVIIWFKTEKSIHRNNEDAAKSFVVLKNEVDRIKVGLASAPKEDEAGPLFSKLRRIEGELAEKKAEVSEDVQEDKPTAVAEPVGKVPKKQSTKATRGTLDKV